MLRYATVLWLLFHLGSPLFVPACCASGGNGSVTLCRAKAVFWISLAMPAFTVLVFCVLEPDAPAWTTSARRTHGLCGGALVGRGQAS